MMWTSKLKKTSVYRTNLYSLHLFVQTLGFYRKIEISSFVFINNYSYMAGRGNTLQPMWKGDRCKKDLLHIFSTERNTERMKVLIRIRKRLYLFRGQQCVSRRWTKQIKTMVIVTRRVRHLYKYAYFEKPKGPSQNAEYCSSSKVTI